MDTNALEKAATSPARAANDEPSQQARKHSLNKKLFYGVIGLVLIFLVLNVFGNYDSRGTFVYQDDEYMFIPNKQTLIRWKLEEEFDSAWRRVQIESSLFPDKQNEDLKKRAKELEKKLETIPKIEGYPWGWYPPQRNNKNYAIVLARQTWDELRDFRKKEELERENQPSLSTPIFAPRPVQDSGQAK